MTNNKIHKPIIKIQRSDEHPWIRDMVFLSLFSICLIAATIWAVKKAQRTNPAPIAVVSPAVNNVNPTDSADTVELKETIKLLTEENQTLKNNVSKLNRAQEMDATSGKETQVSLVNSGLEIQKLKEEVNFYKQLVSGNADNHSLDIQVFEINDIGDNAFSFKLSLSQKGSKDNVKGWILYRVQGEMDGQDKILEWQDIRPPEMGLPTFDLRFFQRLDGQFNLPKGFKPKTVLVKLNPDGSTLNPVQQSYTWETALNGA